MDQSLRPAEVVLVDDGSGDDTLSVIEGLARSNPECVKVIALAKNHGPADTRNAGWDAATQPFVAFLDADDSWHPDKIQIQYGFMRDHPEVTISAHRCILATDGEAVPEVSDAYRITKISALGLIFGNHFSTPTVMLKRNIPFRFNSRKRHAEDADLWRRVAFSGGIVMRIESSLAYIHKAPYGAGGLSAQMWAMEKGDLSSLVGLYRAKHINGILLLLASVMSLAKYLKRIAHIRLTRSADVSCY